VCIEGVGKHEARWEARRRSFGNANGNFTPPIANIFVACAEFWRL
jgi:hypothetical protein